MHQRAEGVPGASDEVADHVMSSQEQMDWLQVEFRECSMPGGTTASGYISKK